MLSRSAKKIPSHTLKVTGISDELLDLLDRKIRRQHAKGRAEYIRELIRKDVLERDKERPFYETATPEERVKAFTEWAESHRRDTPVLSDEAISRESIYKGRGA